MSGSAELLDCSPSCVCGAREVFGVFARSRCCTLLPVFACGPCVQGGATGAWRATTCGRGGGASIWGVRWSAAGAAWRTRCVCICFLSLSFWCMCLWWCWGVGVVLVVAFLFGAVIPPPPHWTAPPHCGLAGVCSNPCVRPPDASAQACPYPNLWMWSGAWTSWLGPALPTLPTSPSTLSNSPPRVQVCECGRGVCVGGVWVCAPSACSRSCAPVSSCARHTPVASPNCSVNRWRPSAANSAVHMFPAAAAGPGRQRLRCHPQRSRVASRTLPPCLLVPVFLCMSSLRECVC
jgi:hypothetical protein